MPNRYPPSTAGIEGDVEFNLADLLECIADAAPDRVALVEGDRRLTHGELDERATRLANHLIGRGVQPGDHVGIYAHNSCEWVESMLAAHKARAAAVNVNFRYVEYELAYLFDDADLVCVIHDADLAPRVAAVRGRVPTLRDTVAIDGDYEDVLAAASPERAFGPRSADDRYLLYTGGTTGLPKGTMWRHEDILFGALQGGNPLGEPITSPEEIARNVERDPAVFLVVAPLMHAAGQWSTLICLLGGGTVVLHQGRGFDPVEVWQTAAREHVHMMNIVGDAMGRPLVEALAHDPDAFDLSSLFVLSSGGAILSPVVKAQFRELLPNALIIDGFGASETGDNGRALDSDEQGASRFTVNAYTAVLDDHLVPVVPGSGQVGRLAKTGPIPLGYHKDPEKTATTFFEVDGLRWVIPGDLATVDADGVVTVLGRGSSCINTGGEKVYPEEVESVLKAHPDVYDAIVVGVPSERWGEEVVALVRPRAGRDPSHDQLVAHCREKLGGYKAPRHVVSLDELVRTPVGKPDHRWAKATAIHHLSEEPT